MESIIIDHEHIWNEGYQYYLSYIEHPVKWKAAWRKRHFIKYLRDLDIFIYHVHYPYNFVFTCCNPPEMVEKIQAEFKEKYFYYMESGNINGLIDLRRAKHDYIY